MNWSTFSEHWSYTFQWQRLDSFLPLLSFQPQRTSRAPPAAAPSPGPGERMTDEELQEMIDEADRDGDGEARPGGGGGGGANRRGFPALVSID